MIESREESTFVHSKTLSTIFWLNAYRSFGANAKTKGCLSLYPQPSANPSQINYFVKFEVQPDLIQREMMGSRRAGRLAERE